MSYDPGALNAALAAAVGEDSALIADLRVAFLESAERQVELMAMARCEDAWETAAWRLKGLAASFGLTALMVMADEASHAAPGDEATLSRIRAILTGIADG